MSLRRATMAIATLGALALLTACEWSVDYIVINETDQALITWPLLEDCNSVMGHKQDYLDEEVVEPHGQFHYEKGYGGPSTECVQVATLDRRLVLSEPYPGGATYPDIATYTVREPLQPLSDPIPSQADLPNQPFTETFMEGPLLMTLVLAEYSGITAALIGGSLLGTRFLYRRFRAQGTAIRGGILAAGALLSTGVWLALVWLWLSVLWVDMPAMW